MASMQCPIELSNSAELMQAALICVTWMIRATMQNNVSAREPPWLTACLKEGREAKLLFQEPPDMSQSHERESWVVGSQKKELSARRLQQARKLDFSDDGKKAQAHRNIDFDAYESEVARIEAAAEKLQPEPCFAHNDLLSGNILVPESVRPDFAA